jgi:hypothetical protein
MLFGFLWLSYVFSIYVALFCIMLLLCCVSYCLPFVSLIHPLAKTFVIRFVLVLVFSIVH